MIRQFFSVNHMLKPGQQLDELPSSKQVYSRFLQTAWPSAVEAVLVGLVGSVDTMMVGGLGKGAIAAVGITNQPKFILLATIFSLNVGVTAIVSRRKGQDDRKGANRCLKQCILLCAVMSLLMALIGFFFVAPIMEFAGATPDYLPMAISYFKIIMVSIFFQALNLTINAAQRGVGNTKISMRTNVVGNIVNLIFNYLLINGIWIFPRWGVAGAAVATTLGAFVACCMSFATLLRTNGFLSILTRDSWLPTKDNMTLVADISFSAFVEQACMRIGFFAYAKIVADLGTTAYATHLICMNILNLSFTFGDGFGIAASSLVGQSLGSKRSDMAIIYGKTGQRVALCVSSMLCILFISLRYQLVGLFTTEPDVITSGVQLVLVIAGVTYLQTSQVVISGCLRGAGDTKFVAFTSLISVGIFRPLLTWLFCFPFGWGLIGAWLSLAVDQIIRVAFNFVRFAGGKWTTIKI